MSLSRQTFRMKLPSEDGGKDDTWKRHRVSKEEGVATKSSQKRVKELGRFKCWTPPGPKNLRRLITFIMKKTRRRFKRKWIPGYIRILMKRDSLSYPALAMIFALFLVPLFFPSYTCNDFKTQRRLDAVYFARLIVEKEWHCFNIIKAIICLGYILLRDKF